MNNKNNNNLKTTGIGKHLIIDLYNCDANILNDVEKIKKILIKCSKKIKSKILHVYLYKFNPCGVSGIIVIAESHISIHTWVEEKYCAIDIFTCGKKSPLLCLKYLMKEFKAEKCEYKYFDRGK